MQTLVCLMKRHTKVFFKDKAMFLSSLITPMILILLFVTFLGNVYRDSFTMSLPEGVTVSSKIIEGFVNGWLFSSLLSVSCITVSFCSNLLMVQDKAEGTIADITIAPVNKSTLSLSYFFSSAFVTLIICYSALIVSLIILSFTGWFLSLLDIIFIIIDVLLLTLFGTALSSIVNYFLSTQGQMSAVGTLVSACYGFICGAYMPLSQFSDGLQKVLGFLPGTYGTSLVHSHFLNGVLDEMIENNFPQEVVDEISRNFDSTLFFFGNKVENWMSYLILGGSVIVLILIFVYINKLSKRKVRR